jgi:hypothetical protein
MQTEAVMARYRDLGSNLEASVQTRQEFQERGQQHWHRLYERCWCGFLTVPASCYTYGDKGRQTNTQEDAEKAYLASSDRTKIPRAEKRTGDKRTVGRPKKWKSEAERLRAYRERSK